MKQTFFFALLILTLSAASCKSKGTEEAPAETNMTAAGPTDVFNVDIPRSELKWNAFKPTGTHHGVIPIEGGKIYVSNGLITGGTIDFNISGIEVRDLEGEDKEWLESHLKGTAPGKEDDFFNVQKYPKAYYTITGSTKLENDPLGTHMINGELTLRDITKPVSFKAKVDLASGDALKATAEPFVIDRSQWEIKFKSKKFFDDLKDDFINDEVKLELTVGALKAVN